ncbi:MAG TPA: class I SAM-dependent methyltransferase [Longimicrobiales bacterium]
MKVSAVIRQAVAYDALTWLLSLGRERRFREQLIAPARLREGESVLDVGCGTGTLALVAKRQVVNGEVVGIDASPEMIDRARHKAARAGLQLKFEVASADALPFPAGSFDVVICTVALHHLRRSMRAAAVAEMRRVLKPSGRVLLADFVFGKKRTVAGLLHHHVGMKPDELAQLADGAGLRAIDSGALGFWDLSYLVAQLH